MRVRILTILIAILAITASCSSALKATATADAAAKKSRVIKAHKASMPEFKTLQSRLSVDYKDESQSRSVTLDLRMEKGKHIWMSARILGFTLAKVHITPDSVQFYEKLQKRYFDGDFTLISEFLGEPLNFEQLEQVLMGQAVEPLENYNYQVAGNLYDFRVEAVISKLFTVRPSDFKLSEQAVTKPSENSFLDIKYPAYQEVDNQIIPKEIFIDAKINERFSQAKLEFNRVELNQDLSFPFSIPSGYSKIVFK
jgi:outer membrane biogenesis lipoprotein LolB